MRVIVFLGLVLLAACAGAHQMSTAYLTAHMNEAGTLEGNWQIRLFDLEQAIGLDADGDNQLLWLEVTEKSPAISRYLTENFTVARDGKACTLTFPAKWQLDSHFNEPYLVIPMMGQCASSGELSLHYTAFFDQDAQHKLLASFADQNSMQNRVLSVGQNSITLSPQNGGAWASFKEFVYQGVIHIWIGIDHILFLLTLLLTCVLTRESGRWKARENIKPIIVTTTWIVTAFTIAHSITLTATALGWIVVPSRWVEVGIAATVVVTALNNIFPLVLRLGWLTFGFGLLHGMGFAGVLGELGLPADQKTLTVLAFNLGVEIGQLAIVFIALPALAWARQFRWYARYGLTTGSALIALVATQWIFERI